MLHTAGPERESLQSSLLKLRTKSRTRGHNTHFIVVRTRTKNMNGDKAIVLTKKRYKIKKVSKLLYKFERWGDVIR